MHNAFECVSILEKLPLQIECIAASGETLLVGTTKGHLLVYGVREEQNGDQKFDIELKRSNKAFARKPILQLSVVQELGLLLSLSDGVVSVYDADTYEAKSQIYKTKGATYFAIDLKKREYHSGEGLDFAPPFQLRLCVIVKKKLMLFHWLNGEFQDLYQELGLGDIPKTVAWTGDFICVGGKREYFLINAETGILIDLFPTGRNQESLICPLPTGELALSRDEMTVFMTVDKDGKTQQKHALTWSDVPTDIASCHPYILATLPKCIEIWSREPRALIQRIDLGKARSIVQGPNCYVSSSNHVWRLVPISFNKQIQQLVEDKQFEVALSLANMFDDKERTKRTSHIKKLYACDLFCRKKKFEESLKLFNDLGEEPTYVIGLFPNLLPEDYRKQLDYPYPLPDLTSGDLERALHNLTEYLTKIRNKSMSSKPPVGTPEYIKMRLQIIDTSLLKCYLHTNEGMIAPLLRLKDNNCHVEECERVLIKSKKYNELVLLYQNKGIHKKALDLLLRQADRTSGPLSGHMNIVEYLQRLGVENLDVIFDYSKWVLKKFPEDGIKIFVEDLPEIEGLPREKVLQHIETHAPSEILKYLEYIIFDWRENKPDFHNQLVLCYKDKILPLLREHIESLPEGEPRPKAGKEPAELGDLRRRMLFLLESSTQYQPLKLIRHFPVDMLFEERALLLGRAGRHENALAIYIYILRDTKMAEHYCRRQYDYNQEENRDVYVSLLKMYLKPNELVTSSGLGHTMFDDCDMEPNIEAAITIMNDHYQKIDVAQALDLLPPTTEAKNVGSFLTNILEDKMIQRRYSQVFKSLLYAEHLQVHEQRVFYQSKKCAVTDERACRVCHRRIGTSAFARYPNGVIVHYYCCKDRRVCPPELEQ